MVADVDNLFNKDSKASKVFSADALEALANFDPLKSVIFWIIVVKTIMWIIFMIMGFKTDRNYLRDNP